MSFQELPIEVLDISTKYIDQSQLDLNIDDFLENDIIILASGTATGKTKNIAKMSTELKQKTGCNILSVVNLITLAREQICTFSVQSKGIIELKNYQTDLMKFAECDGVICANSIYKLNSIKDFNIANTILYIDEVNDLIHTMTHNDSLDIVLIEVYNMIIELIKYCKKIIFSDATINQNTLNFISSNRKKNLKKLLIVNTHKKYKDIDAIRYKDEDKFLDKLREHIKEDNYFLFGCDTCSKITELCTTLMNEFPEKKNEFRLITSKTHFRPSDANLDFRNKYVFYSPSITTGVSFVYDTSQTQFIYMSNKPLISPISFYQMSCRTRNMKNLIYYSEDPKARVKKYDTLLELEKKHKDLMNCNNKILQLSRTTNENDEASIVANTFFKLYCYEEYQSSIFWTGFLEHYENILKNNGFNIKSEGEENKLNKSIKTEMKETCIKIEEEEFDNFVKIKFEVGDKELLKQKYSVLNARCKLLNITTKEDSEKYKIFLVDEYSLKNYFNLLLLFRTEEYIEEKIKNKSKTTFEVKNVTNVYTKITLLKYFENHYKISRFGIDNENFERDIVINENDKETYKPTLLNFGNIDIETEIDDDFKKLFSANFSRRKADIYKFNSIYELTKVYIHMIKTIIDDIPLITSSQYRNKESKKREYRYYLDIDILYDIILLAKMNNPKLKKFNKKIIKVLTGIEPTRKPIDPSYREDDEEKMIDNYLFNKHNYKLDYDGVANNKLIK